MGKKQSRITWPSKPSEFCLLMTRAGSSCSIAVRSKHRNRLTDHAPYQSHETRNDPGKDWDARELDVRGAKDGGAQKKKVRVNSRPTNKHSPRGGLWAKLN